MKSPILLYAANKASSWPGSLFSHHGIPVQEVLIYVVTPKVALGFATALG